MNLLAKAAKGQTTAVRTLKPSEIALDPEMQARVAIDEAVVKEYTELWKQGVDLAARDPMLVAWLTDRQEYVGLDMWHRHLAWVEAFDDTPREYTVEHMTHREAILRSLGVNPGHGLRRSNADKRKAVETMLRDSEWVTWSNIEIAKACAVSDVFVGKIRAAIGATSDTRIYMRNGKEIKMDVTNIGAADGNTNRAGETPDSATKEIEVEAHTRTVTVSTNPASGKIETKVVEPTTTIERGTPTTFVSAEVKADMFEAKVTMPDGSTVFTAIESKIAYAVNGDTRKVTIAPNGKNITVDLDELVALIGELKLAGLLK